MDLAFFGFQWLFGDCEDCNGADFNGDGNSVDIEPGEGYYINLALGGRGQVHV